MGQCCQHRLEGMHKPHRSLGPEFQGQHGDQWDPHSYEDVRGMPGVEEIVREPETILKQCKTKRTIEPEPDKRTGDEFAVLFHIELVENVQQETRNYVDHADGNGYPEHDRDVFKWFCSVCSGQLGEHVGHSDVSEDSP